ncbi:MAG: class II aldolase/adducin family protein [Deltaproteobacteria bacterium]
MDERKDALCTFCRLVYDRRLASGTGGNISVRHKDGFLCTPSARSLRTVRPETVSVLNPRGQPVKGEAPTRELGMHLAVLAKRPDMEVVFHLHGAHIIAASTLLMPGPDSLPPLTPEFVFHAHPLPMLPFMVPGSRELREAASHSFSDTQTKALLLQNHGIITVGRDFEEALNVTEAVDEAARIYVLTQGNASLIPKECIAEIKAIP